METLNLSGWTAAAWLLSVRVVRCPLKCGNERNPRPMLYFTSDTAPIYIGEEGEDDFKSARRLCPGQHTSYNGKYRRLRSGNAIANPKKLPPVQIEGCNPPS